MVGSGANFVITLITFSIIFIFIGVLMGRYAVNALKEEHQASMEIERAQPRNVETSTSTPQRQAENLRTADPLESSSSMQEHLPSSGALPGPVQISDAQSKSDVSVFYRVQVGAFSERTNADNLSAALKENGYECMVTSGPPYRVQTGAFSSEKNAISLMNELKTKGYEAIIVR